MYMIIFEDMTIKQSEESSEEIEFRTLVEADDGLITIIRAENGYFEEYLDGEWLPIDEL